MSASLSPVADFSMQPVGDLRGCPWWRPCTVALAGEALDGDAVLVSVRKELLDAFVAQGHEVTAHSDGNVDLLIAFVDIPEGPGPLAERIPERSFPLAFSLDEEFGMPGRPEHFVVIVSIPETLTSWAHMDVVETSRAAMARIGTPKIVFVTGDRLTGRIDEATYCTLEGGHPTDTERIPEQLRDRLITAVCAHEVGDGYEIVGNGLPLDAWEATRIPDIIVAAGHRMDRLMLLPAPKNVSEYVSPKLAALYNRYLGIKGFSEGMLFAFDPTTDTVMVTASGSWDVDKRALQREEVVAIGNVRDGKLQVLAPEGMKPKGPSVEALEMFELLASAPKVRVGRSRDGDWVLDPDGDKEVPIIRAGIHAHVGVSRADDAKIETVPANRELAPFGFGCGTDLMCEVARDAARRSRAINDAHDPRAYVRWPMLYHGDTVVELWKPGIPPTPLNGLLDLYENGRIDYTPDHIHQPV